VQAANPVSLELDGQRWSWLRRSPGADPPAEGLAVAADKQRHRSSRRHLTPELRAEGLAREVVRRVQAMRKEAGFNIEDRITTFRYLEV
jgi:hypothetical protein